MDEMEVARATYRKRSVRWGYSWAFWCAVLWGAWYIPGSAIWSEPPYKDLTFETQKEFLVAAAVITSFNAIGVVIFLFLWTGVLGKWREYGRTLRQFRGISKWYFLAAIFGGPCAIFGASLAIGFIGPIFAAVAALLYPIVGAFLARIWYNENIAARAGAGILVIVAGGVAIFAPGILAELSSSGSGAWLGYLGGAMAALGWGIEGAIAGRALDVSDPDVGIAIRFTAEVVFWVALILPGILIFTDLPLWPLIVGTFNFWAILWLSLAGAAFGFCYVSWYKSFPLIGVGRGQAVAAFNGIFAVTYLAIFTLSFPDWNFLIGLGLTVLGGFIMFSESSEIVEVIRQPRGRGTGAPAGAGTRAVPRIADEALHLKGLILRILKSAPDGLWDYEIMQRALAVLGHSSNYWKGEVRVTLTDLYSGALIEELEDDLDKGSYFGAGKILVKFKLSPLGHERVSEAGLN